MFEYKQRKENNMDKFDYVDIGAFVALAIVLGLALAGLFT